MTSEASSTFVSKLSVRCSAFPWRPLSFVAASLFCLVASGCGGQVGPPRFAVSGKVILNGKPLTSGVIRLTPESGSSGPGVLTQVREGVFTFGEDDGPVAAKHRVEIEATDYQSFEIDDEAAFAALAQKSGKSPLGINPVPAIYNRASKLTITVTEASEQIFCFDLTSKPSTH